MPQFLLNHQLGGGQRLVARVGSCQQLLHIDRRWGREDAGGAAGQGGHFREPPPVTRPPGGLQRKEHSLGLSGWQAAWKHLDEGRGSGMLSPMTGVRQAQLPWRARRRQLERVNMPDMPPAMHPRGRRLQATLGPGRGGRARGTVASWVGTVRHQVSETYLVSLPGLRPLVASKGSWGQK